MATLIAQLAGTRLLRSYGVRGRLVERGIHARSHARFLQRLFVFLAQERVFEPVWNRSSALGHVNGAFVGVLFARHAGAVLAMVVGAVPADEAQRLFRDAEMGVEPVAAIGRRGDHADGLVILAINLVRFAVLPRPHANRTRPRVGVALAADADENRG